MRPCWLLLCLAILLGRAPGIHAQEPSFRTEVHLINMDFSVRDASGRLVSGLTQGDFEVLEDGVPQKIAFFARSGDLPLALGILLDFSDSQAEFLRSHQKDLQNFLKQSLTPLDRSFLVCFGNHVLLVRDFTREPRDIIDALNRFETRGNMFNVGTAFYDAIFYSVERRLTVADGTRRALVIFSDGEDSASVHGLAQTIRAAQLKDVLVFAIRYTEVPKGGLRVYNHEGIEAMARLAAETGGTDFDARTKNLQGSFEAIAEELHSSYRLAYHSTNPASDGAFRAVRIRVKQPGYEVRAKSGYLSKTGD